MNSISAWASTLLVLLFRAMRRPQFVGRAIGRILRFLILVVFLIIYNCKVKGFTVLIRKFEYGRISKVEIQCNL